jgi:hypothetical protein
MVDSHFCSKHHEENISTTRQRNNVLLHGSSLYELKINVTFCELNENFTEEIKTSGHGVTNTL